MRYTRGAFVPGKLQQHNKAEKQEMTQRRRREWTRYTVADGYLTRRLRGESGVEGCYRQWRLSIGKNKGSGETGVYHQMIIQLLNDNPEDSSRRERR